MQATIKQLQAFVAIATSGSFVEAAEWLHLSQPALSIAIRKLEDGLGGELFSRSSRRVQLTPEGRGFLPIAQRLLRDWHEAMDDLDGLFSKKRGKVTLAALPTMAAGFLPPILAKFRADYPNISINVHDVLGSQVDELVREGRADIGFSVCPPDTSAFHFEPIVDDRFVAVCPLGHPLLCSETVKWEALLDYPVIAISHLSSTRQAIERVMATLDKEMDILCEVSQIATAARLVAAGLGVSVLPSLSFNQVSSEGLGHRLLIEPDVPRTLGIITSTRTALSVAAQAMLKMARDFAQGDTERTSTSRKIAEMIERALPVASRGDRGKPGPGQ